MSDTIYRQSAIDTLDKHLRMTDVPVSYPGIISALTEWLNELPSAQPEPCLDLIVSEIEETIRETKENGKRHDINIRANGELICYGLQLALDIIEEKKNERIN